MQGLLSELAHQLESTPEDDNSFLIFAIDLGPFGYTLFARLSSSRNTPNLSDTLFDLCSCFWWLGISSRSREFSAFQVSRLLFSHHFHSPPS